MLKTGLTFFLAIFFILVGWLNLEAAIAMPVVDLPSLRLASTAPIVGIAMGSKSLFSFSGKRPTNLGVTEGKLAPCPGSPNCVSSQASDQEHQIGAIAYKSSATALSTLKSVIDSMERTKIIAATDDYLYVEFTSGLMGFVDDVEFYLDSGAGVLQVRSASRLGESDLGVNRKRVEEIRSKFAELEA